MTTYQGRCHCGAIKFRFESAPIERGLRCNCSLCIRKGALMSPEVIAPEQLQIAGEEGALSVYRFGSGKAKHYFCSRCGIYPFHETLRKAGHFRVNLGCVEGLDATRLPWEVIDGRAL